MRAMQVTDLGAPLVPVALPRPEPGPGEVLLRVHACGLNFADTLMVSGQYQEKPPLPFVPGMELCGTVVACGAGVATPVTGTRVAAFSGGGGLAEFAAVPAARCVAVPDAMPDAEVAGFLVAYGTSAVALGPCAALAAGETLLVTGASGGVGLTAVELGKLMGSRVIAVARGPEKLAVAARAGADHLLDSAMDIRAEVRALGGADVVYDTVGGTLFDACLRATNPFGRILPIGFAGGGVPQIPANILLVKNLTVIGLYWGAYVTRHPGKMADCLSQLFEWHASGRLHPHVSHVLPLEAANEGLDLLRTRKATGKVVIAVGSNAG